MQIVIDIPDNFFANLKEIQNGSIASKIILNCVKNGTPLPKGHGRLIDADALELRDMSPEAWYSPMWGYNQYDIEDAQTIIEADKEVE